MIAICLILFTHGIDMAGLEISGDVLAISDAVLIWISAALTAGSGIQYLWRTERR